MNYGTNALKSNLADCTKMDIRQTRRGWLQECNDCEAGSECKYLIGAKHVAHPIKGVSFTVARPFRSGPFFCKCCCYQSITIASENDMFDNIEED